MPASFSIKAEIESQLSQRFPAAFGVRERPELSLLPTGIAALDHFCGGVPCGALTEICANPAHSSGICSLLMSLLKTTSVEHFCAFIDGSDAFNVRWADALQVQLEHLLWVRCQDRSPDKPLPGRLDQALKATDLLLKANCGFSLVLLDLPDMPEKLVRRVPLDVWYRFRQAVEQLKAALVITTPAPVTGTCSALVLRLSSGEATWEETEHPPRRHGDTEEIGSSGHRIIGSSKSSERYDRIDPQPKQKSLWSVAAPGRADGSLREEHTHNTTLEEFCIDVEVNRRRDYQKRNAVARLQFTASRSL